jgi:hypothetical protein
LAPDGRARTVEVRKVDGEVVDPSGAVATVLQQAGFVRTYRGFAVRA